METHSSSSLRRRWQPRFSLRALLIVVTVLCILVGPFAGELVRLRRQQATVSLIERFQAGRSFEQRDVPLTGRLLLKVWPGDPDAITHDITGANFLGESLTGLPADPIRLSELHPFGLRSLSFPDCEFDANELTPLPTVKELVLGYLPESVSQAAALKEAGLSRLFPNVENVTLCDACTRREWIAEFAEAPHLTSLRLTTSSAESENALHVEAEDLQGFARLESLAVDTQGSFDWEALAALPNLETLSVSISHPDVDRDDLESVEAGEAPTAANRPWAHLQHLPRLKELSVAGPITEEEVRQIVNHPNIRHLSFDAVDNPSAIDALAEAKHLQEISLTLLGTETSIGQLLRLNHVDTIRLKFHSFEASDEQFDQLKELPITSIDGPWCTPEGELRLPGLRKSVDDRRSKLGLPVREITCPTDECFLLPLTGSP